MTDMKIIECHYIGRSKERRPGESTALGWVNNQWSVIFPEKVLRTHFNDTDPTQEKSLFGVLGIAEDATPDAIKTAYRRMALAWHPDQCREPNAADVFRRIQEAYNILSNPIKCGKYKAGLAFEQKTKAVSVWTLIMQQPSDSFGYRSPLRSGLILCEGQQQRKWFVVSKICHWADIINGLGQTLVTSWVYGEDKPQEIWR